MDKRVNNKGTKGNKGGRPPKTEEQKVVEALKPYEEKALAALEGGLEDGQGWAVKLFMQYYYGVPKQKVEVNTGELNLPDWMQRPE